MTLEEVREETRRRLADIDLDLARDEQEVERQLKDVHQRMIQEADIASRHYARVAQEALTPRYREMYSQEAEKHKDRGEALKRISIP